MPQELFNRNEVVQGPAPECLSVLKNLGSEQVSFYFDGYFGSALIPKLSEVFNLPEEQIIVGYGLEDIFRTIFNSLKPESDTVLTHEFHFTYYDKYLHFRGVKLENFKQIERQSGFVFDVADCVEKINRLKPKVILITSPNNPTGNSISAAGLAEILDAADKNSLVVLDEAYFGFDNEYKEADFLILLQKYSNLMILRSFSKLYALAGLRMGFALCGRAVKEILKYQNPYLGGSRVLEEVAIAALDSEVYYKKLSAEIIADREYFINRLRSLENFQPFNSKANFVLVRVTNDRVAEELRGVLEKEPLVISKFVEGNFLRVTVGEKKYTERFLEYLCARL